MKHFKLSLLKNIKIHEIVKWNASLRLKDKFKQEFIYYFIFQWFKVIPNI